VAAIPYSNCPQNDSSTTHKTLQGWVDGWMFGDE